MQPPLQPQISRIPRVLDHSCTSSTTTTDQHYSRICTQKIIFDLSFKIVGNNLTISLSLKLSCIFINGAVYTIYITLCDMRIDKLRALYADGSSALTQDVQLPELEVIAPRTISNPIQRRISMIALKIVEYCAVQ